MKDKLVLVNEDSLGFFPDDFEGCYIKPFYTSHNLLNRIFRKIILKSGILFFQKRLFKHWYFLLKRCDSVIVFDTGNAKYIIKMINKYFPGIRVIFWYWNSVSSSVSPENIRSLNVEMWSFDENDCNKYGLKKNTQFLFGRYDKVNNLNENNRVVYVGVDKNRGAILHKLKKYFEENDILYSFNLVQYKNSKDIYNIGYKKPIKYLDVLKIVQESTVVIDLVAEWQNGLTLRPLEALFYKKKLITNMKAIKKYDFYEPNNIFILGEDEIETLKSFVESKYDDYNNEYFVREYSFEEWLNRFFYEV